MSRKVVNALFIMRNASHTRLASIQPSRLYKTKATIDMSRKVVKVFESPEHGAMEGTITRNSIRNFDPFLMLDEFTIAKPAGFPDHPHRGFETVTYILSGTTSHEDFLGNKGTIGPGDVQWMTAGRGIVHCELPYGKEPAHGFQLWVNLARKDKLIEPSYQDLKDTQIPKGEKDGVRVKVISGESMGIKSPIYTRTPVYFLDFQLQPGAKFEQPLPADWNAFVLTLTGTGRFGSDSSSTEVPAHHTLLLSKGEPTVAFKNSSRGVLHFLLLAGKPINEPVVQHGPFVMTTDEEIRQAFHDYRNGKNGFENAQKWESKFYKNK